MKKRRYRISTIFFYLVVYRSCKNAVIHSSWCNMDAASYSIQLLIILCRIYKNGGKNGGISYND